MRAQLARQREGTALGEGDGVAHVPLDVVLDLAARPRRDHAREPGNLVGGLPRLQLGAGAVTGIEVRVRPDMLAPAIGHALEEAGTARARSHWLDGGNRRGADRQDVAMLDPAGG